MIDYTKKLPVPPTLWYEDRDGNRHVPTHLEMSNGINAPEGYDYMRSQFPCTLEDSTLLLVRENGTVCRSEKLMTGHTGWSEDLVLAMTVSGKYKLSEAILVVATSCSRCMNALAYVFQVGWGMSSDSEEYANHNTRCGYCDPEGRK